MKRLFSVAVLSLACAAGLAQSGGSAVHNESILVDTHNDVLSSAIMRGLKLEDNLRGRAHSDLDRFEQGGVDAQVFSVWCGDDYTDGGGFKVANDQIDALEKTIARNATRMELVTNYAQLQRAVERDKLAALIGVEGGHMIEENLDCLDSLFARGARYLTLTWNNSVSWATSAQDETLHNRSLQRIGLSEFGEQVIKRMNELGMMVDLSHVGENTFWEAIEVTTKPVLLSHSSVYELCPHFRNLKDEQIKAVAQNGGVVCVNFYSAYIDPAYNRKMKELPEKYPHERDSLKAEGLPEAQITARILEMHPGETEAMRPPLSKLIDHIDYITELVGVDYVGLGSDFDGVGSLPRGLDGVEDFPKITTELQKRGYSGEDIRKILGGNFLRVFKANQPG